jgi:mono/diheme cytochrome c family protein
MTKPLLMISAVLLVVVSIWAQDDKAPAKAPQPDVQAIPGEAAQQTNPVRSGPESLARAKKIYTYDCSLCHNDNGDGKSDVGKDMKLPDFTNPAALKDKADGELFYVIRHGHGGMPPEGDRVKSEQVWDLVNYVRSFSKKKAAEEKAAEEKPSN